MCYRIAGVLGWTLKDLDGASLREMWPMYCGRMRSIRQQVLWQAQVIWREKLDVEDFLRRGAVGDPQSRTARMSDEMQLKTAIFQGCVNRGLPEPDFSLPDWEQRAADAFDAYDRAKAAEVH